MAAPPAAASRPYEALPTAYYIFFAVIEPLLTFAGAARAYFDPARYFVELYPQKLAIAPKFVSLHPAAPMTTRQLGSCFFLFAMMACVLLPAMRRTLKQHPRELEQLVGAYLFCLAAADLTHIGATLYDLGPKGATSLRSWNVLTWGNVGITVVLFAWRMCWFAGVGRSRLSSSKKTS